MAILSVRVLKRNGTNLVPAEPTLQQSQVIHSFTPFPTPINHVGPKVSGTHTLGENAWVSDSANNDPSQECVRHVCLCVTHVNALVHIETERINIHRDIRVPKVSRHSTETPEQVPAYYGIELYIWGPLSLIV